MEGLTFALTFCCCMTGKTIMSVLSFDWNIYHSVFREYLQRPPSYICSDFLVRHFVFHGALQIGPHVQARCSICFVTCQCVERIIIIVHWVEKYSELTCNPLNWRCGITMKHAHFLVHFDPENYLDLEFHP